jgi:hypothetical protein
MKRSKITQFSKVDPKVKIKYKIKNVDQPNMGIRRQHTNSEKCFPKNHHMEMLTLKSTFQMLTGQHILTRPSVPKMSNAA